MTFVGQGEDAARTRSRHVGLVDGGHDGVQRGLLWSGVRRPGSWRHRTRGLVVSGFRIRSVGEEAPAKRRARILERIGRMPVTGTGG
jgi:hypothetical protein